MTATTIQTAVLVAALIIMVQSPSLALQPQEPSRQQLVEQAEQRYRAGDRDESLRLISQILQEPGSTSDAVQGPEERVVLVRALYRRALIHLDAGDRESAARDIERLLALAPTTIVDASLVGREFTELFMSVRERTVTELEVAVEPRDAEVRVDDRRLDSATALAVVASGAHVVTASRSGYTAERREIELRPGGRVRLEIRLSPASSGNQTSDAAAAELPSPKRWAVRHLHNSFSDCAGRLYLEGDAIGFSAVVDQQHSFVVSLSDVREIAGNKSFQGGLKYGGTFHVKLASGANFNFVSEAFPADQLVSILQAAMTQQKKRE